MAEANYLIMGFNFGFHLDFEGAPGVYLSTNNLSATNHKDFFQRQLTKELNRVISLDFSFGIFILLHWVLSPKRIPMIFI